MVISKTFINVDILLVLRVARGQPEALVFDYVRYVGACILSVTFAISCYFHALLRPLQLLLLPLPLLCYTVLNCTILDYAILHYIILYYFIRYAMLD